MLFSPYIKENWAIPYEDALFYQPVTKTGVQSALTNHVIHKEYHVTSSWKCMAYCLSEMTCVSFSYFPQSNTCELNNSTGSSKPEGLRKRPGTEYYEKRSHSSFLGWEAGSNKNGINCEFSRWQESKCSYAEHFGIEW